MKRVQIRHILRPITKSTFMRTSLLLSAILLQICGISVAQSQKAVLDAPDRSQSVQQAPAPVRNLKGGGDIFWQTSFNWADATQERGWSLPEGWEIKDNTDNGNVWTWRNDTIKGRRTVQPVPDFFVTGNDGFVAVPMDEYNFRDGITTAVTADCYIQTPGIDCSAKTSVVVKFSQFFRLCCSNYFLDMLVTNDDGVHWATYDIRYGVSGNNTTTDRFQNVEINISDVAAGMPNVKVRFYMHGMAYYFWMIDDLSLSEAYDFDVKMEDYWVDFDGGAGSTVGHINYWPLSQMGMAGETSGTVGDYYAKAAFLNNGKQDAEDNRLNLKVLKNGTEVLNELSAGATIWSLERDTENIVNPFLANDFGDYRFDFASVTESGDEVPANNQASLRFTVNDSMGHRADFSAENFKNTASWSGGGRAGDMVSVDYHLYSAGELNSMTAYIGSFTAAETPQFQFVLMKYIDEVWEEVVATDVINMDSSYLFSWVTLPVAKDGESEFLTPGDYKTCVRMWGVVADNPNGSQGISIGLDVTTKYGGASQYFTSDGAWHTVAGQPLFMIGFNVNKSDGPKQAPVIFNVDMTAHIANGEFHPGSDKVDVKGYAASWSGTSDMSDPDGDGIYTVSVENLPVNMSLEYKYRVNGVEEAYPATGNRKYVIRYWNVLNNKYNNGVTTGIPSDVLVSTIHVFPNPSDGHFTVSVSNPVPSAVEISVLDIAGKVMMRKNVGIVANHTETIDSRLSTGVYFIRISNGSGVKVQKLIVQ
ncbi:MAG TPA: hypothetical protein DC042_07255 [Bacteroidales bacterium]|nr:hypothetical protein [Bacteroidales bacterium]